MAGLTSSSHSAYGESDPQVAVAGPFGRLWAMFHGPVALGGR